MITQSRLRELLDYDPASGLFRWRKLSSGHVHRVKIGDMAGGKPHPRHGYIMIHVDGKKYAAHRLAWLHVHGQWPAAIDHKNRIRHDNKLSNLRLATRAQNKANCGVARTNKSGFKGVRFLRGRWESYIKPAGKTLYLGRYDTPEEAHTAYMRAALEFFGEFATGGRP